MKNAFYSASCDLYPASYRAFGKSPVYEEILMDYPGADYA